MNVANLKVRFSDRPALDVASLSLDAGESYAVIGHNGCGKSTLLRCLAGVLDPDEGVVERADEDTIRYMPQNSYAFYGTVRKNVLMGGAGAPSDAARADFLIEQLQLKRIERAHAKSLSGGETARMAFARTLMGPSTWLLLDEPTAAFDGESMLVAERLIERYRAEFGAGAVVVTHSLKQAERMAGRLVFMDAGRVVEQGPTEALLRHPRTPELERFLELFGS